MQRNNNISFMGIINELNDLNEKRKFLKGKENFLLDLINEIYFLIGVELDITTDHIEKAEMLLDILVKKTVQINAATIAEIDCTRIIYEIIKKYFSQYLYLSSQDVISSIKDLSLIIKKNMHEIQRKKQSDQSLLAIKNVMPELSHSDKMPVRKEYMSPLNEYSPFLTIEIFAMVLNRLENFQMNNPDYKSEQSKNNLLLVSLINRISLEFKRLTQNNDPEDKKILLNLLSETFVGATEAPLSREQLFQGNKASFKKGILNIVEECFRYYLPEKKSSMAEMVESITAQLKAEKQHKKSNAL